MIDNTNLPMTAIALAAGFGSLRRFNTVFAAVYKRPPTALRRTSHLRWPPQREARFLPIAANAASALVATVLVIVTAIFLSKTM